ncbi:FUSC family protein [Gordonia phthalatica]|uniref:Membrane protein n=1 Tax=Gordonia phthalatica TaxID=1136941 RepID=A0A0N9NLM0_9ACTN|nr:FUSC family protein [Gordonia phthalatica]ALG87010.1 membrane protein [Gordonia phthalatica]
MQGLHPTLRGRVRRLWLSIVPISQCAIAAGLAWFIAFDLLNHERPFFAPIAAVVSLGLSLARRWRRSVELIFGVSIGILVGDVVITWIGSGAWQISVVVAAAMAVAVFADKGPMLPTQAASSAVLVATLLPPGDAAAYERAVDAVIGGLIGVLVGALVPVNPARRARRDAAGILNTFRDLSHDLATALRADDEDGVYRVLAKARGSQAAIDGLRADVLAGREVGTLSPLYWGSRPRLKKIAATADPIDNAVRNFRVVNRRALALTQRGVAVEESMIEIIDGIGDVFEVLRQMMLAEPGESPDQADAARALRSVVRKARTSLADDVEDLSEAALLVELRSLLVDLMMVAGLSRMSAIAQLHLTK